jgi:hypothetical protein
MRLDQRWAGSVTATHSCKPGILPLDVLSGAFTGRIAL